MKNLTKKPKLTAFFGFTAIIAVIALALTACDTGGGRGDPCDSGHTFTQWKVTTVATCTEDGEETQECSVCGTLGTVTQPIAALGHDHTESLVCIRTGCDHQYALGGTGPAGGKIFYIAPDGFTVEGYTGTTGTFAQYTAHYLEVAPANAANSKWRGSATANVLIPASTGITTRDSFDALQLTDSIGKGRRDTQIIVAFYADTAQSTNATAVTDTAANRASDYTTTFDSVTYNDWFLPSLGELNLLYGNKNEVGMESVTSTFWSSSQFSGGGGSAWYQDFANSDRLGSNKNYTDAVRAVRAF